MPFFSTELIECGFHLDSLSDHDQQSISFLHFDDDQNEFIDLDLI